MTRRPDPADVGLGIFDGGIDGLADGLHAIQTARDPLGEVGNRPVAAAPWRGAAYTSDAGRGRSPVRSLPAQARTEAAPPWVEAGRTPNAAPAGRTDSGPRPNRLIQLILYAVALALYVVFLYLLLGHVPPACPDSTAIRVHGQWKCQR